MISSFLRPQGQLVRMRFEAELSANVRRIAYAVPVPLHGHLLVVPHRGVGASCVVDALNADPGVLRHRPSPVRHRLLLGRALHARISSDSDDAERSVLRWEIVGLHAPLVQRCARQAAWNAGISEEDGLSKGLIAASQAVSTWDPRKGPYSIALKWEIIREFNRVEGNAGIYIGRKTRTRVRCARQLQAGAFARGKPMPLEEVAERVGLPSSAPALAVLWWAASADRDHLDVPEASEDGREGVDVMARQRLALAYSKLSAREREVLRLRFEEDASLRDIGKEIDLSGERVRQILAGGVQRLQQAVQVG